MTVRKLVIEALYTAANQCCIAADWLTPRPRPMSMFFNDGDAIGLFYEADECVRVLGPDGFWHEVPVEQWDWTTVEDE